MSFVTTQPEALTGAAGYLTALGTAMTASNSAAAECTTGLAPAASDEVSVVTAAAFSAHATLYQEVSSQAAVIGQLFVSTLQGSAGSYEITEAANSAAAR